MSDGPPPLLPSMRQCDKYWHLPVNRGDPIERSRLVDPSPDPLPYVTRAIRCESGGSLSVMLMDGETTTLWFKDGETRPIRVCCIMDASDGVAGIEILT